MHPYETLAIIVLALSTASPAFSAPVLENQQQAGTISNNGDTNRDTPEPILYCGRSLNLVKPPPSIEDILDQALDSLRHNSKREPSVLPVINCSDYKHEFLRPVLQGIGNLGSNNHRREPSVLPVINFSDYKHKFGRPVLQGIENLGSNNHRREPSVLPVINFNDYKHEFLRPAFQGIGNLGHRREQKVFSEDADTESTDYKFAPTRLAELD